MEYSIGILLSLFSLGTATAVGLARERAFYPTIMVWIASYYVLFAVMSGDANTLLWESLVAGVFLLSAMIGYMTSLWIVATALVGHGVFDFVHHLLIDNPGVPSWWPGFCLSFDVIAGGFLIVLLRAGKQVAGPDRSNPPMG